MLHDCTSCSRRGTKSDDTRQVITSCSPGDCNEILEIINDGAQAYKGVIPEDLWHEPYMARSELQRQLDEHVVFWGYSGGLSLAGVMGIQCLDDITLIRHAYIRNEYQHKGIGSMLLTELRKKADKPFLIGTWAAASWAIRFYQKHGFRLVPTAQVPVLLNEYWSISRRQAETSVVLGDEKWFAENEPGMHA